MGEEIAVTSDVVSLTAARSVDILTTDASLVGEGRAAVSFGGAVTVGASGLRPE